MNGTVAAGIGLLGDKTIRPLAFDGHCYYVRKCIRGEKFSDDFWERHIGGVILPQAIADQSHYVEVLAIGPGVGQPCSKAHMHKFRRAKYLDPFVSVGDILLCPGRPGESVNGIRRSPLAPDFEFFIEESVPLAVFSQNGG